MRYTAEIEGKIIAAVNAAPDRDLILPDWAYWKGDNQPYVYVDGMPVRLARVLYRKIIGPLSDDQGLAPGLGMHPRNVNPHRFVVTASPHQRAVCPNGKHEYTEEDRQDDGSMRCHQCYAATLTGGLNPAQINAAKTTCPEGHDLVLRPNGRRRCLECPRAAQRDYARRRKSTHPTKERS